MRVVFASIILSFPGGFVLGMVAPLNFAELDNLTTSVGVIGHGYPEDDETIFQDIGASKAPQPDCSAAPAGSSVRLLHPAGCQLTDCID